MSSTFRYNLLNDFTVNDLFILSTTVSSNLSTGALQVSGGFALNSGGNIGGNLNMNNNRIMNIAVPTNSSDAASKSYVDALSVSFNTTNLVVNGTIQSVSTGTGSLQIYGGVGIGGNIYTGGIIVSGGTQVVNSAGTNTSLSSGTLSIINNPTFSGITTISNSTTSNNTASGALIVNGGIGSGTIFSQNIFQNGNQVVSIAGTNVSTSNGILSVINNPSFSGIVNITNSTISNSTATGSLVLAGGLGINGSIYAGSIFQNGLPVPSIAGTNISISSGIISVISNPSFSGNTTINSTVDSTSSTSTASLVVSGGLSLNKSLFIGNSLTVQNLSITGYLGGVWLNLPTTGPSSIGNGGAGVNPMLGYINSNGTYYTNSLVGDTFVKSKTGRIVFGNTATSSSIAIQNDLFGIGNINPAYILDVTGLANFATGIQITGTANSTNSTSGGSLTVLGGVAVAKNLYIGSGLNLVGSVSGNISLNVANTTGSYGLILPANVAPYGGQALISDTMGNLSWSNLNYSSSTFNAQQNVTNQNVTGLVFNSTNFDVFLQADVSATTSLNSLFELRGIINGAGSWVLSTNFVGDTTNITFGINPSTGQIYYSSPTFTGWTSTVFKYSLNSSITPNSFNYLSVGTSYSATGNPSSGNFFTVNGSNFTDNTLASSSTSTNWSSSFLGIPTLSAVNTNITTTRASTLQIVGSPIAGTNETILNSYSLSIDSGIVRIADTTNAISTSTGAMQITGGLGIGGNIYAGSIFSNGSQVLTNGTNTFQSISITGTNVSTNTGNGALTVVGGVGIAGDLYCNSFNANSMSQITLSSIMGGNILNLMDANLGNGSNIFLAIGTNISNGNVGFINFMNVTGGSSSNSMNLGLFGQPNNMITLQNNGFVGINTQNPNFQLQCDGNISIITNTANSDARYHLYNNAGVAEWKFGQRLNDSNFTLNRVNTGVETNIFYVLGNSTFDFNLNSPFHAINGATVSNGLTVNSGNINAFGVIESTNFMSAGYNTSATDQNSSYGFAAYQSSPSNVLRGILLWNTGGGSGAGTSIDFANFSTSTPSAQIQALDDGAAGSSIVFKTRTTNTTSNTEPIERLRIDSNGRIGINTQNPLFILDVAGRARSTTGLTIGNSTASVFLDILGSNSAETRLFAHSDGNSYLQTAGLFVVSNIDSVNTKLSVDNSGNVITSGSTICNTATAPVLIGENVGTFGSFTQGLILGWNRVGGSGRGMFGNNQGGGQGGFEWVNFNQNGSINNVGMTLGGGGILEVRAHLYPMLNLFSSLGSPTQKWNMFFSNNLNVSNTTIDSGGNVSINGNCSTQYIGPTSDNSKSIGTASLRYQTIFLANNPTVGSSKAIKNEITPISKALNFVKELEPKRYKIKNNDNQTSYGFIAEEVYDLLKKQSDDPEIIHSLVHLDPETKLPKALKYGEFNPILWSAVRELANLTETLQQELAQMKKENLEFKNRLDSLEKN